jgi:hypothetical protein
MITEDYCSYEVAKLLKEKGFEILTGKVYDNQNKLDYQNVVCWQEERLPYISAPTHQMAMKWLREEKRTSIIIEFDLTKRGYCPYVHQLDYDMDWVVKWRINIPMKYEEAVETALKYSLENLI